MIILILLGWINILRADDLSQNQQWLNLLHYQKTMTGLKSEADGGDFFLSPKGKTDPALELRATVDAFNDPRKKFGKLKLPAACVFTGRIIFLEKHGYEFPKVSCPEFETWRMALPIESLSLVFASSYPNNPASMFGHTFLRLNTKGGNPLLDYAVNFAATTGVDGGVEFALLGVFGGYEGHYSLAPYFIKVNEYNNSEARDLWEYPLKLNQDAINLMLAHLWELESTTYFDYYFFDENCSWQILRLLEAAAPELKLSAHSPFYVVPSETVRILADAHLLDEPIYRPSLSRVYSEMKSPDDKELLKLRLDERKGKLKNKKRYHELLVEKAREGKPTEKPEILPTKSRPDLGHGIRRLSYTEGGDYRRLNFRFALHDVLDLDLGHDKWSTLDVLRFGLEHRENRILTREMVLVDVLSLHNVDGLGFEPSWFLKLGAINPREFRCEGCLTGALEAGLGSGIKTDSYILSAFLATRSYGMNPYNKGYYFGVGPRVLMGYSFRDFKILLDTFKIFSATQDLNLSSELSLNYALRDDLALRFHYFLQVQHSPLEYGASFQFYF